VFEFPEVTIGIITYNRPKEILETLAGLNRHLIYPADKIRWILSDDCSPGNYANELQLSLHKMRGLSFEVIRTSHNGGWGYNANWLVQNCITKYLFQLEDDYVLRTSLDLRVGVALLQKRENIGMIRYRGTEGTGCVYHQGEVDVSDILKDYQSGLGSMGKLNYLGINAGSPTLWIYSNGPHLKRIPEFHQFYGRYPEGLRLGATEESYAHTVKNGMTLSGAPGIAIFSDFIPLYWDHIGHSYQDSEFDICHKVG